MFCPTPATNCNYRIGRMCLAERAEADACKKTQAKVARLAEKAEYQGEDYIGNVPTWLSNVITKLEE